MLVLWLVPGLAFTKYRCEFVNPFCIYANISFTVFKVGLSLVLDFGLRCVQIFTVRSVNKVDCVP